MHCTHYAQFATSNNNEHDHRIKYSSPKIQFRRHGRIYRTFQNALHYKCCEISNRVFLRGTKILAAVIMMMI